MKAFRKFFYLSLTTLLFAACSSSDDSSPGSAPEDGPDIQTVGNAYVVTQKKSTDAQNTNKNNTGVTEFDSRYEVPRISGDKKHYVLLRKVNTYGVNYILEWDNDKKSQRWTAFQWYNGNSGKAWNRNNWDNQKDNEWAMLNMKEYGWGDPFQPDPDLPKEYRTELNQYKGSGYSRGHILASADRLNSKDANEQTYYLSNIMPQTSACNTGTWGNLENLLRTWNSNDFRDKLYVVKGGTIADGQTNGTTQSGLVIPKYFFMAVMCEKSSKYNGIAFIVDHVNQSGKGTDLKNYAFSIDQLEELTGIDFFCNLPDNVEDAAEKTLDTSFWTWKN